MPTKSLEMTVREMLVLQSGLSGLDRPHKEGASVTLSAEIRMACAKNMVLLTPILTAFEKQRQVILRQKDAMGEDEAIRQIEELLDTKHTLEVQEIPEAALQVQTNQFPVQVLAALLPILLL